MELDLPGQARRWQISMGGAEPPKFPKITPFCKGPPLPPYKNFLHGGAMAPLAPPSATGLYQAQRQVLVAEGGGAVPPWRKYLYGGRKP